MFVFQMIMQHFPCVTLVMMKCTIVILSQFQKTWQTAMHVQSNGMRPVQADDTALVFCKHWVNLKN